MYYKERQVLYLEEIIKDIIDADREAREKVECIKKENTQFSAMLQEQRLNISKELEITANEKRVEAKAQLEKELSENQTQRNLEFETTSKTLSQMFEKEKQTWIHEIYNHCLQEN